MLKKALLIVVYITVAIGCTNKELEIKRQSILSNIKQLEQQKELLFQRLIGREQKITSLQIQSDKLMSEIRAYNGEIEAFMMDHKTALLCMAALGVSLNQDNQYSQKVKDLAKIATAICGAGAIVSKDFRQEVVAVADKLIQADSHAKNLQSQLKPVQSGIETEKSATTTDQSEFDKLASEIQTLRSQLSQLK